MLRTVLMLILLTSPLLAQTEVYVRNQPVPEAVVRGGERFIPVSHLERLFTAEEIARLQLDYDTGDIRVDGSPLTAGLMLGETPRAPVVAIAEALGFKRQYHQELDVLDLISPRALTERQARQTRPGGAEWETARRKMEAGIAEKGLSSEEQATARVRKIGDQIAAVSDAPSLEWHFHLLPSPDASAASTGIGFVFVTDGLLALGLSDVGRSGLAQAGRRPRCGPGLRP
ncbi:MAG: hypothetical protein HY319_00830 [Armatimonadetes bacterium]|nr:hypothetical protein [Armatimonadota bacterium]